MPGQKQREDGSHRNETCVEPILRHWQPVGFGSANIGFYSFPNVGECGVLCLSLGYATGKTGAFGHPVTILPAINEDLPHPCHGV